MAILAVDTACGTCSVALAAMDGTLIATLEETEISRQAERLVPMMLELLGAHQLTYIDLTLLVTTLGPGSFTGLRIGMTAIKGTALVTKLPTIGVSTLETIAFSSQQGVPFLVLLNAMRGQVYAQKFSDSITPAGEPALIEITEIADWAEGCHSITGNCSALVRQTAPDYSGTILPDIQPHARDAAALAAQRFAQGQQDAELTPLYIRSPDAKPPKPIAPL